MQVKWTTLLSNKGMDQPSGCLTLELALLPAIRGEFAYDLTGLGGHLRVQFSMAGGSGLHGCRCNFLGRPERVFPFLGRPERHLGHG
jgi:hypothetical protein